jgi:hypothetical protein
MARKIPSHSEREKNKKKNVKVEGREKKKARRRKKSKKEEKKGRLGDDCYVDKEGEEKTRDENFGTSLKRNFRCKQFGSTSKLTCHWPARMPSALSALIAVPMPPLRNGRPATRQHTTSTPTRALFIRAQPFKIAYKRATCYPPTYVPRYV